MYRPTKGNDYKFMDRRISEMFTVGGVDVNIHKYLGIVTQGNVSMTEPGGVASVTSIQDLLFLENRDRKYDTSIYTMRTVYHLNDNDFDLTQFGLFLTGDTMFAVFHLNDMIESFGRKLMVGDVMELPNLKDYYPLDDSVPAALKRYYVVNDATRAAEGFSATWYPHLWRVKLQPLVDSQEYKDILNNIVAGEDTTNTLGQVISTYNKYVDINDAIVSRAEQDVPASGYDTSSIYTEAVDANGYPVDPSGLDASQSTHTLGGSVIDASATNDDASDQSLTAAAKVEGYLTGDGLPPNGASVAAGISFPQNPGLGDFYLRLDYIPNRLFRYDSRRWIKIEDSVRSNLTPGATNTTQLSGFINDSNKFMSNSIAWDGIRIASGAYTPAANAWTLSFNVTTGNIVTKVGYVSTHRAKTYLNGIKITNTISNASGNIGITVANTYVSSDLLEYTVYEHVINERQSLSQALRPSADNI